MKIAFLNIYNGVVDRGAETFVKELADRLSKENEVWVFQSGEPTGEEKYKVFRIPSDIDPLAFSSKSKVFKRSFLDYPGRKIFAFTLKTFPKILKEKFDVIIPVNGGWMPAFIRVATWLYGGKMIISGQSGIGWDDLNNLWCFPNVFVALSTAALEWAKKTNPFVKSVYIPNGVDLTRFKNKDLRFKNETKTVLAVGAFTEQKRLDLAIDAVAKLEKTKLIIAGGGGDLKEKITDYGLKKLGKERFEAISVPFEKMPEIYQKSDVFTLPSAPSESFGNVIVEAMASGLPVVVTDDPIRREIVGDAGIFVDPTNIEVYAECLEKALNTDWDNKPRLQAEKFSWKIAADEYEKLFHGIFDKQ